MHLKKFLVFGLMAVVLPAVAEEAADRKTATSLKYVEHELDTRQNKFTAEQNKAMEYTNAAGMVQKRTVKSDLGSDTSDTSLPMVGGVNTKLDLKQNDIEPVNDHTAVTYTGTAGGIGRKGIYQTTESYAAQSDNLIDAKTFNAALKNGLDSEFRCSDNRDPVSGLCWLYTIHNATEDNTLLPTGYTPLEYIETDGSQYLVLPQLPHVSNIDLTVDVLHTEGTNEQIFLAPASSVQPLYTTVSGWRVWKTGGASNGGGAANLGALYDRHSFVIKTTSSGVEYYVDGVQNMNVPVAMYTSSLFANQIFNLGARTRDDGRGDYFWKGKIYSFKAECNGNVCMNLIPAKDASGTVGMYDTVSNAFLINHGGDREFIAGPETNDNNLYIPQNQ